MKNYFFTALSIAIFGIIGCNKDDVISPTEVTNVSLSIKSESTLQKTDGTNALVIESAKVLLKNIKFHQFPSDNSADVKAGPFAVSLNLSGSLNTIAVANIPTGLYDRVGFRIHKPEDLEPIPDPEFREGASGQLRYSLIVRGTYNSTPFVYKSRENATQEVRLTTPITVNGKQEVNVTLVVDPQSWFLSNGVQLDPTNNSNAQTIDEAIKNSFSRAFKDDDRNGRPD